MKTTLELPDHLMREVRVRAAKTDRKLKDVVAELIQRGLDGSAIDVRKSPAQRPRKQTDALEAVFAAGDALAGSGVDIQEWAAHSREVWR